MAIGRRQFVSALGSATIAWPFAARATGGRPHIGVLDISTLESDARNLVSFREGLDNLGYVEGRTVDIDYRSAAGDRSALAALAKQLVQLKPDVVLATTVSPASELKRAAPALPIVCPSFSDAFIPDLAASFAHPGGSVTGIASDVEGLIGKLIELTLDVIPGATRIGFLANPAGGSMARFEQQVLAAAQTRGLIVRIEHVEKIDDFDDAFRHFNAETVQAAIVPANGLLSSGRRRIVELALANRLPLIFAQRDGVDAGGLASYGIDIAKNYGQAASYVSRILKGTPPGDLPIEFPSKVELVISLKAAKALGVTVPPTLLTRADEVLE